MNDDITATTRHEPATNSQQPHPSEELQHQITALTQAVHGMAGKLTKLHARLETVERNHTDKQDSENTTNDSSHEHDQPAPWVVFTPPAAAEDHQHRGDNHDPNWTLDNFVAWYNATYVGLAGGPAKPIPTCWRQHPGLAMEVATLAYTWRRANIGATANVRDAQYWHHQWRPGFATRLTDWVHTHCLDGRHREVGATARTDRFGHPPDTDHLLTSQTPEPRSA